ncbi:MAG TPA: branched-chain amino acid ABC transporter substrate-binding protein [Actinomycetota bacterium]|nr:branched-chain amino acid ABC transporter substrate-binding protein [Actinomycetota bacterium]
MKQRRWFTTLALVAVLSIVAAACADDDGAGDGDGGVDCATVEFGCVEVGPDDPINIGVAQVISGADANLGDDQVNGIELAVDHRDGEFDGTDGTLLDHPIELTIEDDGCTAEGGQAAATALSADTSIVGVIGTSCSSGALGVADTIFSEKGITIISGSNTNPALTAEGTHQPYYLRTAHNDRIQGAIVAEFTLSDVVGAQTAATIADESPYTQGLVAAFEQNFEEGGGTLTSEGEQVVSTDTDFQAQLRSLAEGDPDVLYFPIFVAACTLVIRQAQAIMPDTTLVVSDGCLSSDTLANAGEDANGVYASSPDPSGTASEFYADEFIPAYQEAFGSAPLSVFHAHAYDATNILMDAIEEVAIENDDGSLSIPRKALRDAVFATEGYEGVIGTFTCTELGDCATDVAIGIYEAPAWPVEGGTGDETVYTDVKSLDEVL